MRKSTTYLCLVAIAVGLAACGGGGGGAGGGGVPAAGVVAESQPVATPGAATPLRDCSVDLWGDSILHGQNTHGPLAESPADYIKRVRSAYTVEDKSVNGQGINSQAAALTPAAFADARFHVLEWGVNDTAQGYTDVAAAYRRVVASVQAAHKTAVITGIDTAYNNPAIIAQPLEVATDMKVAYAGWDKVQGGTADGLHPDQATSNALAQRIVDSLDVLAPECSK